MSYLYGDTTPFPLAENFVETLQEAVDACVALFREEADEAERKRQRRAAEELAARELASLELLAEGIDAAVRGSVPPPQATATSQATAGTIGEAARATVEEARNGVRSRRTQTLASLEYDVPQGIRQAISPFLLRHQLPHTRWSVRWQAGVGGKGIEAGLQANTPEKIAMIFAAKIPPESPWSAPLKVAELVPELVIYLEREGGLLRKRPKQYKTPLHRHLITQVKVEAASRVLMLRPTAKKPSAGLEVRLDAEASAPTVTPVDETSQPTADGQPMAGESAEGLGRLWTRVDGLVPSLVELRDSLLGIWFEERATPDFDEAEQLARRVLASIAPLVLEMRRRSGVPGEIGLKRLLGDGRREEIFLPLKELQRKYASLPDEQRRAIDAIGLGDADPEAGYS